MKTIDILKNKYIEKIKEKILTYKKTQGGFIVSDPIIRWSDINFRRFNILDRVQ